MCCGIVLELRHSTRRVHLTWVGTVLSPCGKCVCVIASACKHVCHPKFACVQTLLPGPSDQAYFLVSNLVSCIVTMMDWSTSSPFPVCSLDHSLDIPAVFPRLSFAFGACGFASRRSNLRLLAELHMVGFYDGSRLLVRIVRSLCGEETKDSK